MPAYAQLMSNEIAEATGRWSDGDTIDVLTDMQAITAHTTMATMFAGTADASLTDLLAGFEVFWHSVYQRMFMPPPLTSSPLPATAAPSRRAPCSCTRLHHRRPPGPR